MLSQSTRQFARSQALIYIAAWRRAKAIGVPKATASHRSNALFFIRAFKTGVTP